MLNILLWCLVTWLCNITVYLFLELYDYIYIYIIKTGYDVVIVSWYSNMYAVEWLLVRLISILRYSVHFPAPLVTVCPEVWRRREIICSLYMYKSWLLIELCLAVGAFITVFVNNESVYVVTLMEFVQISKWCKNFIKYVTGIEQGSQTQNRLWSKEEFKKRKNSLHLILSHKQVSCFL